MYTYVHMHMFPDVFGRPGTPLYSYLDNPKTLISVGKTPQATNNKGLLTYTRKLVHRFPHSADVMLTTIKKMLIIPLLHIPIPLFKKQKKYLPVT